MRKQFKTYNGMVEEEVCEKCGMVMLEELTDIHTLPDGKDICTDCFIDMEDKKKR